MGYVGFRVPGLTGVGVNIGATKNWNRAVGVDFRIIIKGI